MYSLITFIYFCNYGIYYLSFKIYLAYDTCFPVLKNDKIWVHSNHFLFKLNIIYLNQLKVYFVTKAYTKLFVLNNFI